MSPTPTNISTKCLKLSKEPLRRSLSNLLRTPSIRGLMQKKDLFDLIDDLHKLTKNRRGVFADSTGSKRIDDDAIFRSAKHMRNFVYGHERPTGQSNRLIMYAIVVAVDYLEMLGCKDDAEEMTNLLYSAMKEITSTREETSRKIEQGDEEEPAERMAAERTEEMVVERATTGKRARSPEEAPSVFRKREKLDEPEGSNRAVKIGGGED